MALQLGEICDTQVLDGLIGQYVTATAHPDDDLWILNYTPRAQFDNYWTPETRLTRGLIVRGDHPTTPTNPVIARPLPKFHNADEHLLPSSSLPSLPLTDPVTVTEKVDGSLGIIYPRSDGTLAVATRGSFTGVQAAWATRFLQANYPELSVPADVTYLVEIVYPGNRVVVDYKGATALVLLAIIDNATGADLPLPGNWIGPVVPTADYPDLTAVLEAVAHADPGAQHNAEGFVVRFDGDPHAPSLRVKVKYAEYLRLHRYLTNLDSIAVFEAAGVAALAGHLDPKRIAWALFMDPKATADLLAQPAGPLGELVGNVPDEMYPWVRGLIDSYYQAADQMEADVRAVADQVPPGLSAPERAAWVKEQSVDPVILFGMLNGRPYRDRIWRLIRPTTRRLYWDEAQAAGAATPAPAPELAGTAGSADERDSDPARALADLRA